MRQFFSMDSPIICFLSRLCDLMILNFLFIVCCIPIFTIGDALTALYYVNIKIATGEEGYVVKGFFRSFKLNFRQATIIWLIVLLVGVIFAVDFMFLRGIQMGGIGYKIFGVIITILAVMYLLTITIIFPLLARFDNTIGNVLKNSVIMSILYLPRTLAMIAVEAIPFVLVYFYSSLIPLLFLFGVSVPAFINAKILAGAFKKLEDKNTSLESDGQ